MTETPGKHQIPSDPSACVFCEAERSRIAWSSPLALAVWDGFPVSLGHALIVPRRHAACWDDLTPDEKAAIISGVDAVRALIAEQHSPDAFNIGFNDGLAAGQTVMHFHMHVIPRYTGDTPDPRGGVRWVLGDKAVYWKDAEQ
jgi:diadenosine tetraphosphate (Ap4A) HIT family hydrolase